MRYRYTLAHRRMLAVLRDARIKAGISQVALSKKLNRPDNFINKVERAERMLNMVEFVQIANTLGMEAWRLVRQLERSN